MREGEGDLFSGLPVRDEESLRRELAERSGQRLELKLTRNRVTMASVRFLAERHVRLRLHEAFLGAPEGVRAALAGYLRTRRRKHWSTVCAYARTIRMGEDEGRGTRALRDPSGLVHDLGVLAREVNAAHFQGRLRFTVGWGGMPSVGARRSIRYGSCNPETRQIRIHPLLDHTFVPEGFVRYILFHEMLHLVVPPEYRGGRRMDHGVTFRRLERAYPGFEGYKRLAKELLVELSSRGAEEKMTFSKRKL